MLMSYENYDALMQMIALALKSAIATAAQCTDCIDHVCSLRNKKKTTGEAVIVRRCGGDAE